MTSSYNLKISSEITWDLRLIIILMLFSFSSCKFNKGKLFTSLSHRRTGIDFRNMVKDSEKFNVLDYPYFYNGGGVAVGDINNDGFPDIFFSGNLTGNKLYLNKGNFRFEDITDKAEANIGSLAEHGITGETQKVFIGAIAALNNVLKTPRSSIAEKKKATERLIVLYQAADKALEMMDFAVGIVKDEQVDFVTAYYTSRKLVDTNTGNVSLKAKATDLANGAPVKGVIFTFTPESTSLSLTGGNGQMVKKTAAKGSFQIKNMPAGTYKVLVQKPGYKDKEVSVSISDGERSDLSVALEK